MNIKARKDISAILYPIIVSALVDKRMKMTPILECVSEDIAAEKLSQIKRLMSDTTVDDKVVAFWQKQEGEKFFVVCGFEEHANDCDQDNKYCDKCGIFHWNFPSQMNTKEVVAKKTEIIAAYDKKKRKERAKMDTEKS